VRTHLPFFRACGRGALIHLYNGKAEFFWGKIINARAGAEKITIKIKI